MLLFGMEGSEEYINHSMSHPTPILCTQPGMLTLLVPPAGHMTLSWEYTGHGVSVCPATLRPRPALNESLTYPLQFSLAEFLQYNPIRHGVRGRVPLPPIACSTQPNQKQGGCLAAGRSSTFDRKHVSSTPSFFFFFYEL